MFLVLNETSKRLRPRPHLQQKLGAASRTIRCFEAIRQARMGLGIPVDRENDPAGTGLIGQEFTLTTTDRGVLEAKLTSVNPNFAALFVQYFHDLNLKPGAHVAMAMTGSFPALNIAALAAAEEMGLHPIPITSVGASMWGANDPEFSWLDMERLLNERGLLETKSIAASLGGSNDRGRGLSPKGRFSLQDAITRNDVQFIHEPTLDESIQRRVDLFDEAAQPGKIKAYVNIGGGAASIGNRLNGTLIKPGINKRLKPYNWSQRGALHHFAQRRVPVVHILNVPSIASTHGFPIAPEVVTPVGEGEIYHQEAYNLHVTVPSLVVYLLLCFFVLRSRQKALQTATDVARGSSLFQVVRQSAQRRGG
jgi:poly-gamma-glutamate system protein